MISINYLNIYYLNHLTAFEPTTRMCGISISLIVCSVFWCPLSSCGKIKRPSTINQTHPNRCVLEVDTHAQSRPAESEIPDCQLTCSMKLFFVLLKLNKITRNILYLIIMLLILIGIFLMSWMTFNGVLPISKAGLIGDHRTLSQGRGWGREGDVRSPGKAPHGARTVQKQLRMSWKQFINRQSGVLNCVYC